MDAAHLPNLHDVPDSGAFTAHLGADLARVSLLNFHAPWAAPCAQTNAVVRELARKFPSLLVLNVQAEEQEEIAESFDVEAVPTFVLLRGHTLLARIDGADASALTAAVTGHLRTASGAPAPLAHSDKMPAPPAEEKEETEDELNARLKGLMNKHKVVLFMKGSPDVPRCGFSRRTVALLREQKVTFDSFDILSDESVRSGLKVLNDWPTFPQLVINGEFVGGLDIVTEMAANGELQELLEA